MVEIVRPMFAMSSPELVRLATGLACSFAPLAGTAIFSGCAGTTSAKARRPRTEMRCVVTLREGGEIECAAPSRAVEGERCNCALKTGPIYLGRIRVRKIAPSSAAP